MDGTLAIHSLCQSFENQLRRKYQPSGNFPNPPTLNSNFIPSPKTAHEERRHPIFVALERGLNVNV